MIKIELKYKVTNKENDWTVANVLRRKLDISTRLLTKLKMNEKILVNSKPVFSNFIVHTNDFILVKIDFEETDFIKPEPIDLDIIFEDEYLLAVNKPAGIVVHPSSNHLSGTLANGIKYYLDNSKKIRPVNRLDRDTSGIVLFAKNEYVQELMIKKTKIYKEYLAIVEGIPQDEHGIIDLPIARKPGSIMERYVSEEGQEAITEYELLKSIEKPELSLLKIKLHTGRTHQIRVHLSYLDMPILGDTLYGRESELIERQALHAYSMKFNHPITRAPVSLTATPSKDFLDVQNNF